MLPIVVALSALAAPRPLDAAVRTVTVYSDRARVTREAAIDVHGPVTFELPLQARTADPRSVAVTSNGAELTRVDVTWAPADELPRARVEKLLEEIATIDDRLAQHEGERAAWQLQLDLVAAARPTVPPVELGRPQPRLGASGWAGAVEFLRARAAIATGKVRALEQALRPLRRERERLLEEARKVGATTRPAGYRVRVHLNGRGPARVQVTYFVGSARWRPTYDVQLQPSTSQLELRFAGEVSQESGEDWADAKLVLSTAEPATATRYPKVNSWKIGERERFVPTPVAIVPRVAPLPPADPVADERGEVLRGRLESLIGNQKSGSDADRDGIPDAVDKPTEPTVEPKPDDGERWAKKREEAKEERPAPILAPAPEAPPPPAPPAYHRHARLKLASEPAGGEVSRGLAHEAVGLGVPQGWARPSYASDLPAALAGGYDLVFPSLMSETVIPGKGTRRVALLSRRWPVTIERKIFPAVAADAFLVAELRSREPGPLPGGQGRLFVGADPAGTAQLPLIVPGAPVTLPLGLDRAIRPVRNVKVTTRVEGVIKKDEVSEYVVTIEVANPYPSATQVRVIDQLPLVGDRGAKNVEVKLTRAEPAIAARDEASGALEWRVPIPAAGKATITFAYTLKRPKGYQLRQ